MGGLRFPGEAAIQAVLPLVPAHVQARGGRVRVEDDGALVIATELPDDLRATLEQAGAEPTAASGDSDDGRPFLHWAELVRPVPDDDPDLREVLFVVPEANGWLTLAHELVRLGCDDVRLAQLDGGDWALHARMPPYYTVARSAPDAWTAFTPAGALRTWVEVGWQHPLADQVRASDDAVLLVHGDGRWQQEAVPAWTDLVDRLDLVLPEPDEVQPNTVDDRLAVTLRLIPAPARGRPTLWVIDTDVGATLQALLDQLPDAVVDRLELARGEVDGAELAVVRARPGSAPPTLEGLSGQVAHPHLPTLYVPAAHTIDPPLRPHTVRRLLDPGDGRIGWLQPTDDGAGFAVRHLSEDALTPLADAVLYAAARDDEAVEAWLDSSRFDWEPLDLPIARVAEDQARRGRSSRSTRRAAPAAAPEIPEVDEAPAPGARREPSPLSTVVAVPLPDAPLPEPAAAELELHSLQEAFRFRASPERSDLWAPMAEMHHALEQPREAALCWSRALWEADAEGRAALAEAWAARVEVPEALPDDPDPVVLSAVVARVLSGDPPADIPTLQAWLGANDGLLDVRSRWLVRREVARLAGEDALALARGRDAVLASMRAGLAPTRDVPAFLRTSTTPEERRLLVASLDFLDEALPDLAPTEAPVACSQTYAALVLAWARACLGLEEPARAAVAAAEEELPADDAVHQVLLGLYRSGVEEAIEGLPAESPPPVEVREALAALPRFDRYKVERLRDVSVAVLAEPGSADAFTTFVRNTDEELVALPADQLFDGLRTALAELDDDEPTPGLLAVLQAVVGLEEAPATTILDEVIALAVDLSASDRVPVLVEAVSVAAALRRPERAEQLLPSLRTGLSGLLRHEPSSVTDPVRALARSVARCGIDAAGRELFADLSEQCPDEAWEVGLRLSAALAQVGGGVEGEAERALALLEQDLPLPTRLAVIGAAADLAAPLPVSDAVKLWRALVPQAGRVPDSYSTNSHFALCYLQVVEVLAAAHVHPDRLLGPEGRAWVEGDEHRVRLRIHREDRF